VQFTVLTKKLVSSDKREKIRVYFFANMKQFCVLLVLVAAASAASDTDGLVSTALRFVKDCNDKSLTLCIKVRLNCGMCGR
jgi:hypothetical protein